MTTRLAGQGDAVSLSDEETSLARDTCRTLAALVPDDEQPVTLQVRDRRSGRAVEAAVPAAAMRLLVKALARMADGHSVTLLPLDVDLSTQRAAQLLGVSRPYFVKLLEKGQIPFHKVGSQRRVKLDALRRYIADYQKDARRALDDMTADAERLGLYD